MKLEKSDMHWYGRSSYIKTSFSWTRLRCSHFRDITPEVQILQEADHIFIQGLRDWGLYDKVWQAGVILLVQAVGVSNDERTYERAVALRAVNSVDAMTATWTKLPYEFLEQVSNDIINKVEGINRVTFDISSKPPATIEWE